MQKHPAIADYTDVRVAVGHHQQTGSERRPPAEGHAHAPDVGRDHRAAARDGAVHRPVRAGVRRQAARRGRVHPRAQARARLQAAPGAPARGWAAAGGDPPPPDSPAAAVGAAAQHEAEAAPHPVPRHLAAVAGGLPVAPPPRQDTASPLTLTDSV